jgi:hypothetical protein
MANQIILRFSLNGDTNSKIRNKIDGRLMSEGFTRGHTATWQIASGATAAQLKAARSAVKTLVTLPSGGASLDHIWLYID